MTISATGLRLSLAALCTLRIVARAEAEGGNRSLNGLAARYGVDRGALHRELRRMPDLVARTPGVLGGAKTIGLTQAGRAARREAMQALFGDMLDEPA